MRYELNDSEKPTRIIVEAPMGIALYEGRVEGTNFVGTHKGAVETWEEAERWLRGETVQALLVYSEPEGTLIA